VAYFNNSIGLISRLYPSLTWRKNTQDKILYLTFDDGPVDGPTGFVLEQLRNFESSATFFCVGENISKNKILYGDLLRHGHSVGNHTYNHVNGWKTSDSEYFDNVAQCHEVMKHSGVLTGGAMPENAVKLMRPPYGKIKRSQITKLKEEFEIVMWDVLSGDFDQRLLPEECLKQTIRHTRAGSIIIFHDSYKAEKNLRYVLPRFLEHFTASGFLFKTL
jgi:peptidoglycan/xylan/chitin deacetylase (PgdA/CDA1 family)